VVVGGIGGNGGIFLSDGRIFSVCLSTASFNISELYTDLVSRASSS